LRLKNTSSNAKRQKTPAFLLRVFERAWSLPVSGACSHCAQALPIILAQEMTELQIAKI